MKCFLPTVCAGAAIIIAAQVSPAKACSDSACQEPFVMAQAATSSPAQPLSLDTFRNPSTPAAQPQAQNRAQPAAPRTQTARRIHPVPLPVPVQRSQPVVEDLNLRAAAEGASATVERQRLIEQVQVVDFGEVNEMDLAAGPAPADLEPQIQAEPQPAAPAPIVEQSQDDGDGSWMQRVLLAVGGAFAVAAAAARLLLVG